MELVKKLNTFKNEKGEEIKYYQIYLKTEDGHLIAIKAVYKTDSTILKYLANPIDQILLVGFIRSPSRTEILRKEFII